MHRALLALALLASACAADRTAILVEVTSPDLAVPADVDGLRFEAVSQYGSRTDRTFAIDGAWPHSLTIVPLERERAGTLRVTVTATRGGSFVVRRVVETSFEQGTTRRVLVELPGSCRGVMCAPDVDCRAGACAGIETDAGIDASLPDGGPLDAGDVIDSGDADDAGITIDAGDAGTITLDSGTPDGGIDSGTRDSGIDGGPRDSGTDAPTSSDGGGRPPPTLLINEIDYDQPSTDTAEFIEIRNVSTASIDLTPYTLYLINGSSVPATSYGSVALTGTLAPGQYLVVGSMMVISGVPGTARTQLLSTPIQNGDPDGVALWNEATSTLVDSLAYGGAITMATVDGSSTSLVEGTATTARDSSTAVRTVCRFPDGGDTGDDDVDYVTCATPTPGVANIR